MADKKLLLAVLTASSLMGLPLSAPAAQQDDGEVLGTRDYLGDRSRVGSLAGTLIGGALTAHPVGTVVGSVVGYVVGKTSDFSAEHDAQAARQQALDELQEQQAVPVARANPLAQCFGDRSRKQARDEVKPQPVDTGGSDAMLSLVSFQALDTPAPGRGVMAAPSQPSTPLRLATRSSRGPCYYYSSW